MTVALGVAGYIEPHHLGRAVIMRLPPLSLITLATALSLTTTVVADDKDTPSLKKDDKIVFLGDSITAGGVSAKGYVTLIKNYLADKHKDLGVQVIGAGI